MSSRNRWGAAWYRTLGCMLVWLEGGGRGGRLVPCCWFWLEEELEAEEKACCLDPACGL